MRTLFFLCVFSAQDSAEVLINQLGHSCYQKREMAHRKLKQQMSISFSLRLRDITPNNFEAKRRHEILIENYKWELIEHHKIDLRGYPVYPWMWFPQNYSCDGLSANQIRQRYIKSAPLFKYRTDWMHYREATEHWLTDRTHAIMNHAFNHAFNEKDFHFRLHSAMELLQKDIDVMIEEEDRWCGGKESNPWRIKK